MSKIILVAKKVITRGGRGATAVEYGLLVALIAAVLVTVVATLGTTITGAFTNIINGF